MTACCGNGSLLIATARCKSPCMHSWEGPWIPGFPSTKSHSKSHVQEQELGRHSFRNAPTPPLPVLTSCVFYNPRQVHTWSQFGILIYKPLVLYKMPFFLLISLLYTWILDLIFSDFNYNWLLIPRIMEEPRALTSTTTVILSFGLFYPIFSYIMP